MSIVFNGKNGILTPGLSATTLNAGTYSGNISNTSVLATGTLSARSLQDRFADVINVKDFGAVGNSITNDTQALSAAFNYLLSQNGGTLYIPKGIYNIRDRINITCTAQQHIKVIGDGRYISTLRFSGANNLGLNFVSTSLTDNQLPSFEVSDLGLIATRDNVGTALTFNYTNSNNIDATVNLSDIFIGQDVDNISETGSGYGYWNRGIFCNNARNGEIRNLHFYGEMNKAPNFTSSGITLSGESTAFVISDTLILESTTGIYATGTSEGVYVHNSDIVGVYYGVYHDIASGAEPQLTVTDSHINAQNVGVWTKNVQQSVVANCLIYANSWLTGSNWPAWTGVLFDGPNSRYNKVVGCTFAKENTRTGDTTTGIDFNEGGYYTATGNHFFGFNGNQLTYGVQARAGVTNCVVGDDNIFHFVTAPTSFHPNASSCFRQALLHTTNTGDVGINTIPNANWSGGDAKLHVKGDNGDIFVGLLEGSGTQYTPTLAIKPIDASGTNQRTPAIQVHNENNIGVISQYFDLKTTGEAIIEFLTTTAGSRSSDRRGLYGRINSSGFVNVSDHRIKTNVQPLSSTLTDLCQLRPVSYKPKANQGDAPFNKLLHGFIAHEVQEIPSFAFAVDGEKDAVKENGEPEIQSLSYTLLIPALVKGIQELKAINDDQAQAIASLESRLANVEAGS